MSSPTYSFGPVVVKDISPSKTGSCLRVRLQQDCWLTYPPGVRAAFTLQEALSPPATDVAQLIRTLRRTTQTLSLQEGSKLTVGQAIDGHLQKILQDNPRYPSQKPNYDGGYGYSVYQPEFTPDLDLRTAVAA